MGGRKKRVFPLQIFNPIMTGDLIKGYIRNFMKYKFREMFGLFIKYFLAQEFNFITDKFGMSNIFFKQFVQKFVGQIFLLCL